MAKEPKVVYLVVATVGMGMILGSKFGKEAGLYQSISTGSRVSVYGISGLDPFLLLAIRT